MVTWVALLVTWRHYCNNMGGTIGNMGGQIVVTWVALFCGNMSVTIVVTWVVLLWKHGRPNCGNMGSQLW